MGNNSSVLLHFLGSDQGCLIVNAYFSRHSRKMRQWMLALQKAKTPMAMLAHAAKLRPDYFSPELPAIAEFSRQVEFVVSIYYFTLIF
jgi:hypothetical protein